MLKTLLAFFFIARVFGLDLIEMSPKFIGEEDPENGPYKTKYFSDEEKKNFLVTVRNGRLYLPNKKLHTIGLRNSVTSFVVTENDEIYSIALDFDGIPNHFITDSSFTRGGKVKCAGTWKVVNGELHNISDNSSRYFALTRDNLNYCVQLLKDKGIDTDIPVFHSI